MLKMVKNDTWYPPHSRPILVKLQHVKVSDGKDGKNGKQGHQGDKGKRVYSIGTGLKGYPGSGGNQRNVKKDQIHKKVS